MAEEITVLWQEAEQHLRAFEQLARRTVEEAWLAGDALMRIKEQVPHGGWRAGLEERGISKSTAHRFITLRKRYPEMSQVGTFRSVQAALTDSKKSSEVESAAPSKRQHNPAHPVSTALNGGRTVQPRRVVSPYLVTLDDLWDWERWGPSAIARRFMEAERNQCVRFSHRGRGQAVHRRERNSRGPVSGPGLVPAGLVVPGRFRPLRERSRR